ncbi:MAG: extracellular solute-binding protein [Treponema sp.]|jgi:multiple sugar transport system substrate-binding protein|nr:extracellular solute-binding protein [Treponema sp.]
MSLREKLSIITVYCKNIKKSIQDSIRIDIFLILGLFVLVSSPIIINLLLKFDTERKRINLFISPQIEKLFGKDMTEALLQEFREQNPELRIRLLSAADENDEPDIFIFEEGDFSVLAAMNSLIKLNRYTNYEAGDIKAMEQLAIPLVSFMDLLFYNIDVLAAAGFDRPPKTREEFLNYARTVSNNEALANVSGTAISLNPRDRQALSRDVFSWIWASGGDFWAEGNRPILNTVNMADDISFLCSLYNEKVLAHGIFEMTGEQRLEEFSRGKTAMMVASSRAIPFLREKMGDKAFGITTIPLAGNSYSPAGKYSVNLSGIYAGINTKCANPDEAWRFLLFLAEKAGLFCEVFKAVPGGVSNIVPGDYARNDTFYSKAWDIFEASRVVQGFSRMPAAKEYENIFWEELRFFFRSNRTAQATITAIQQRWDEKFNEK